MNEDQIWLIDDDSITNFVNKIIIERNYSSAKIKEFLIASDALNQLQANYVNGSELPNFIFLDINMPEMNGWEFLEAYKKLDPKITDRIKLFMLTSSQNEDDVERAGRCKVIKKFVSKPLKENDVVEILRAS
ncbi:response regulator [Fulvivirga lutimaris]|uniref:response regulator n=1 Tax=Fulvivirga lutimaris TaxID=1819566 RepID=UPI0012BC4CA7|nr:response regulator [Fulvivirga lutimaris]MTI38135.1 response regulator [Fulvivirga lutimaris]